MKPGPLPLLLDFARAILRDTAMRRRWLGGLTATLVVIFFLGAVPLADWLDTRPFLFLLFWLACLWLLLGVVLLALYDLLSVIAAGRKQKRELLKKLQSEASEGKSGENDLPPPPCR